MKGNIIKALHTTRKHLLPGKLYLVIGKLYFVLCSLYFSLSLLCSCGDGEADACLRQAEAQLPDHPDSAQTLLNHIANPFDLSDANRAYYGLLRTWTDDLITFEVGSDTLLRETYLYYNKVSDNGETSDSVLLRRYAQSCYLMGRYYISADSTKQAEDCLRRATVLADRCHDYRTTYLAFSYMSEMFKLTNSNEAIGMSLNSLKYYTNSAKNTNNYLSLLGQTSECYLISGNYDSAYYYAGKMYDISTVEKNFIKQGSALRLKAAIELERGNKECALEFAKRGMLHVDTIMTFYAKYLLADCYLKCDSISKAESILTEITQRATPENKFAVYHQLAHVCSNNQDETALLKYHDSCYDAAEQMYFEALELKDAYYHDVIKKEKLADLLKYEKQLQKQKTTATIIVATLLIAIAYLIFRRHLKLLYRKRSRSVRQHRKDIQDYTIKLQELQTTIRDLSEKIQQKEQSVIELQTFISEKETAYKLLMGKKISAIKEQEKKSAAKHQKEIDTITAQMETIQNELNMAHQSLTEKQAELSTLQATLKQQEKEHSQGMNILAEQAISQSSLYIKLMYPHTLNDKQDKHVKPEDWREIERILNTFYKDFAKRLKEQYPTLNEEGFQLCLMIKMGLTNKKMSSYFSIEESAIQKRKSFLKKNIFNIQDKNIYIDQILADF